MWDYDRELEKNFSEMERSCLPFKFCSIHCTGLSPLVMHLTKPIVFALLDKEARARTIPYHQVDDALLEGLEMYGIPKDVVPAEMDGCVSTVIMGG